MADEPGLADSLREIGFEGVPADETIPEVAREADVGMSVIPFALEASGYYVQGFEPDGFVSPLPEIVGRFFSPDEDMAVGNAVLLAGPVDTVVRLAGLVFEASFLSTVGFSLVRIAGGFVAAFVSAVLLALAAHR